MEDSKIKSAVKIALLTAAALILSIIMAGAIIIISAVKAGGSGDYKISTKEMSEGLVMDSKAYTIDRKYTDYLDESGRFAMLIDEGGNVVWDYNRPDDIPDVYSLQDIASLSRWYLNDYPVYVRIRDDGIFVMGSPKGSYWKYELVFPSEQLEAIIASIIPLAVLDTAAILMIGIYFNRRSVKKREQARTEWIAGISHDIRTPLTVVMGCAEDIYKQSGDERADLILKNGESISSLVSDMNLVNKLQYGMQPLNIGTVRPASLIRSAAAEVINSSLSENYEIEIGNLDNSIIVKGDEKLLIRALINLIRNSISHNPYGCKITVELERKYLWAVITIRDNGVGFPASVINGERNTDGSHGLGLVIAEKTIKSHGGRFKLYNSGGACAGVKLKIIYMP